jgi:hypothetical protein
LPVFADPHGLVVSQALVALDAFQDVILLGLTVGRNDAADRSTDHLVGEISEQAFGRFVPAGHGAVQRLGDDGLT